VQFLPDVADRPLQVTLADEGVLPPAVYSVKSSAGLSTKIAFTCLNTSMMTGSRLAEFAAPATDMLRVASGVGATLGGSGRAPAGYGSGRGG